MTDWICKEVHTDNGGYFEPVTELIRCKDCRYNADCVCVWHSGNDYTWIVVDNDYCSWAERKDNETD